MQSIEFPQVFRVEQSFDAPTCTDIEGTVHEQLAASGVAAKVGVDESVAITAGSRGITNIARIIKATADFFSGLGAKPFIVPSMGSHGGGTAEGQRQVIESYGITEEFCGCPVFPGDIALHEGSNECSQEGLDRNMCETNAICKVWLDDNGTPVLEVRPCGWFIYPVEPID